jgi:hypothetical protein
MATIRLAGGSIITKDGKVSCSCCFACNLNWETSPSEKWEVSNNGNTIRYNVEDSENCGGTNAFTQTGTATAEIQVVGQGVLLGLSFSGLAELEDTGFENISFYLNNTLVASATSAGGDLGCEMGPPIQTFHVEPPYLLEPGDHDFRIEFTTGDGLYHVGSFYQANFTCTPAP